MRGDPDRDLRERFATLRAEDRARAPSFDAMLDAARSPARPTARPRSVAWAAAAAAVTLAALAVRSASRPEPRPEHQPPPAAADATTPAAPVLWRGPTDFLLRTPGSELLGTVPALGRPGGWRLEPPGPGRPRTGARPSSTSHPT